MKKYLIVFLAIILFTVHHQVYAHGHHGSDYNGGTTAVETTTLNLPSQSTYGLLGLAANNQFDWGVPDKVQVGVTMAFTEGGNQAIAVGGATMVGGIMIHGQFVSTIDGPDTEDDYAVIVGGTMRF